MPSMTFIDYQGPAVPASWLNAVNDLKYLSAAQTPEDNLELTIQLTSDTQLTIKVKGSDGVVRSVNLTLA